MRDGAQIRYNRERFRSPDAEVLRKLLLSRREYEALEKKPLNCPVCGFRVLGAAAERSGIIEIKCHKCKFEGPVNLAYFRLRRKRGGKAD